MKFEDVPIDSPAFHLCSGMPDSGKTVTLFSIADRIHKRTKKDTYVVIGEGQRGLPGGLPKHVKEFRGVEFPLDSIVLMDDAHLVAHARRFQSNVNVELDKMHGTLRHDGIDYLYDTQSLRALDVNNILRSNYRWYKKPYQMDKKIGRMEVREELENAESVLKGRGKTCSYLVLQTYRHEHEGLVTGIPLPEYWTDDLSRMHRRQPRGWRRLIPT